ncbi:hypothetical protein [Pedobacter nototheniae]|uniref:hypothetical protein n=1 Tax=Pedobacter nototheniae TaxID=2488994 RepID=UPI00104020F2|nr:MULTISPECIES: hypothetical protein [Pedobacter]
MKKLILICLLAVAASGCKVIYGTDANFTIGMSESDFMTKNKATLVSATENGDNIYRTFYQLTDRYKFFFFKKGKLVRFEEGINSDDFQYIRS